MVAAEAKKDKPETKSTAEILEQLMEMRSACVIMENSKGAKHPCVPISCHLNKTRISEPVSPVIGDFLFLLEKLSEFHCSAGSSFLCKLVPYSVSAPPTYVLSTTAQPFSSGRSDGQCSAHLQAGSSQ